MKRITIRDFMSLSVRPNTFDIDVLNNEDDDPVFSGNYTQMPENLLETEIDSWDAGGLMLVFQIARDDSK